MVKKKYPRLPFQTETQQEAKQSSCRTLPGHLPREIETHLPDTSCCPGCGGTLREFGEDVSEVLEYVPETFKVIRHLRPKFSCGSCETVVEAAAPSRPITRPYAGPGLLAHVLVAKYCDHTPLHLSTGSPRSMPAMVWFVFSPDRCGEHPQSHLKSLRGTLQADGTVEIDNNAAERALRGVALGVIAYRTAGSRWARFLLAIALRNGFSTYLKETMLAARVAMIKNG